jgi:hypothetical protein
MESVLRRTTKTRPRTVIIRDRNFGWSKVRKCLWKIRLGSLEITGANINVSINQYKTSNELEFRILWNFGTQREFLD